MQGGFRLASRSLRPESASEISSASSISGSGCFFSISGEQRSCPEKDKLAGIAELPDQRLRLPLGFARVKQAEQGKGLGPAG